MLVVPNRAVNVTDALLAGMLAKVPPVYPLKTKAVWAPGLRVPTKVNVGVPVDRLAVQPVPDIVAPEGATEAVPGAKVKLQDVPEQVIAEPPLFLTAMAIEVGAAVPPPPETVDTETMSMLELAVALFTRLKTEAVTIPPTPRTAAIIMKRSRL